MTIGAAAAAQRLQRRLELGLARTSTNDDRRRRWSDGRRDRAVERVRHVDARRVPPVGALEDHAVAVTVIVVRSSARPAAPACPTSFSAIRSVHLAEVLEDGRHEHLLRRRLSLDDRDDVGLERRRRTSPGVAPEAAVEQVDDQVRRRAALSGHVARTTRPPRAGPPAPAQRPRVARRIRSAHQPTCGLVCHVVPYDLDDARRDEDQQFAALVR